VEITKNNIAKIFGASKDKIRQSARNVNTPEQCVSYL
jgi:hypothetical protein